MNSPRSGWTIVVLLLLATFGGGVYVGRQLGRSPAATESSPQAAPPLPAHQSAIAPPPARPAGTQGQAPREPAFLRQLKAFSELNHTLAATRFRVPLLTGTVVNPDFIRLYGLTGPEAEGIAQAVAATKLNLARVEAQRATITHAPDGGFAVSIPTFPTEGGQIYDQFISSIRHTLGEERYAYFAEDAQRDLNESNALGMFGLSRTEMIVKPLRPGGKSTSQSTTDRDKLGMGWTTEIEADSAAVKALYPLIYEKLVGSGMAPVN